jgi:hypothetical protein
MTRTAPQRIVGGEKEAARRDPNLRIENNFSLR